MRLVVKAATYVVMSLTLGVNIAALQAQTQLDRTNQGLSTVFERLSSGQRINGASDDPAGLAVAETLLSDRRLFEQARRNVNDGISYLQIGDAALESLTSILMRQSELAEQAANGSLTTAQRVVLSTEFNTLVEEFNRIVETTEFNDLQIFGTAGTTLSIQAGIDSSANSQIGTITGDELARTAGSGEFELLNSVTADDTYGLTIADLNGDGINDLALASYNYGTFSARTVVHLGNGDGTFGGTVSFLQDNGYARRVIEHGDFNGDGVLDLAVAGYNAGVDIFIGNGNGTFQAVQVAGTGTSNALAVGDLNGDNQDDLFFGNGVMLSNGDGTFGAVVSLTGNSTTAELADVNGDGALDAISAAGSDISVAIGDGNGGFATAQSIATAPGTVNDLAVTDLDLDGDLDIGVSAISLDAVILRGDGSGTFSVAATVTQAGTGRDIEFGDIDGDGRDDLLLRPVGFGGMEAFSSDGSFNFTSIDIGAGITSAQDFEIADVDGDGVLDIVAARNTVASVYIGSSTELTTQAFENITTQAGAQSALTTVSDALERVTLERGVVGASLSRLETATTNLANLSLNFETAEARIRDADIASEAAELVRLQVLQQAGTAVLAQANLQSSVVLELLGRS